MPVIATSRPTDIPRAPGALSDADVATYREQFPFLAQVTFLNNGSIAPLSIPVRAAISRVNEAQAMGTLGRSIWRSEVGPLRSKIASLVNATPPEITLLRNTVEAISTVAAGVDWR